MAIVNGQEVNKVAIGGNIFIKSKTSNGISVGSFPKKATLKAHSEIQTTIWGSNENTDTVANDTQFEVLGIQHDYSGNLYFITHDNFHTVHNPNGISNEGWGINVNSCKNLVW